MKSILSIFIIALALSSVVDAKIGKAKPDMKALEKQANDLKMKFLMASEAATDLNEVRKLETEYKAAHLELEKKMDSL